ncbi:MAG: hypothetical protein AAF531_26075 [Actinomycetota bacterium]
MSEAVATRTRQPKSATRAAILQRAYEMYLAGELDPGDERLSLVLDSLGYTTGAGYQIWANQAAFRKELAVYVADNIQYASLEPIAEEAIELAMRQLPFEEHVLHAGDLFVKVYQEREDFFLSLRFFAMSSDRPEEITKSLVDAYERSTWEAEEILKSGLERFGRRFREPFTMRDLTTTLTAMLEGFSLRKRVQPDAVTQGVPWRGGKHHLFSVAFLALLIETTEAV